MFDLIVPKDDANGFKFSMNSSGFLRVSNYTSYEKFDVWISCTNAGGVYSGMRGWYNAHIEYQKPFEVPNLPPSFKVGGTDGIGIDFS